MSSYINFFVRLNDQFVPLTDYSRSSFIYDAFRNAPYEKVRHYSCKELQDIISYLSDKKKFTLDSINKYERENELLTKMDGDVDEKLQIIRNNIEAIAEIKADIEYYDADINTVKFLYDVENNYRIIYEYKETDGIYAGIEAPVNIKEEDIVA